MKLWLISQDENRGYDTYDSAVVAAETEEDARITHPSDNEWDGKSGGYVWAPAHMVKIEMIGEAKENTEAGVICASFNAG